MDIRANRKYAIEKIKALALLLEKENIHIEKLYLFGSYANGDNDLEWSDIDVAIVSNDFCSFRFDDNKRIIPFVVKVEPKIQTHPFTVKDFEDSPFAHEEIVKKGISIF